MSAPVSTPTSRRPLPALLIAGIVGLAFGYVALLVVNAAQIMVGIAQSRMGLPELLVGLHMLLACLVTIAVTNVLLNLRKPVS